MKLRRRHAQWLWEVGLFFVLAVPLLLGWTAILFAVAAVMLGLDK